MQERIAVCFFFIPIAKTSDYDLVRLYHVLVSEHLCVGTTPARSADNNLLLPSSL
jgi:hypothetical protein